MVVASPCRVIRAGTFTKKVSQLERNLPHPDANSELRGGERSEKCRSKSVMATEGHAGGGEEIFSVKELEAKITKYFEDKATLLGIKFRKALIFDEGLLNSWFQENKLPIVRSAQNCLRICVSSKM